MDKFVLANDRVNKLLEWNSETPTPSTSYYDRDTCAMEEKVRRMLRNSGFGTNLQEPGDFINLDGEKINPELERLTFLMRLTHHYDLLCLPVLPSVIRSACLKKAPNSAGE